MTTAFKAFNMLKFADYSEEEEEDSVQSKMQMRYLYIGPIKRGKVSVRTYVRP